MNRKIEFVTTATPWGNAQQVVRYAPGVNFYSTAGHGGFKLSKRINDLLIPQYLKQATWSGLGLKGWYEEDCDWAIVVIALSSWPGFRAAFDQGEIERAHESLKQYHPAEYARFMAEMAIWE